MTCTSPVRPKFPVFETRPAATSRVQPRLKTKLLIGAATLATVAQLPVDEAAAKGKWQPWLAHEGQFGSYHQGQLDIFVPLVQDPRTMIFLDAVGLFNSDDEQQGSIGLGYRTILNHDWIVGINGYFDVFDSQYGNTFYQGGVGLEALTEDFDVRLNGHFPEDGPGPVPGAQVFIDGNDFGIISYHERAMQGVEGEVGWKIPLFPHPNRDIRLFAGGFYYWANNVDTIAGPKGRIELRLYDIDFLTVGSRVTLGAEMSHDDVRGFQGFGSIEMRIPLAAITGGGQKLTGLDRRMTDRVVRDKVITGIGYYQEPVFVNNGDAIVDTIFFAEADGTGDGTADNPDGVGDAIAAAGPNSVVVVDGSNGVSYDTPGIELFDGQNLIGGGKGALLTGVVTYTTVYFLAPGTMPTIAGTVQGEDLISFVNNSTVAGLNLEGTFNRGISGDDVGSNFWIDDNVIDLSDATGDGIHVEVNNPLNFNRSQTPSGVVTWNNVTGQDFGLYDGVDLSVAVDDGAAHAFDVSVTENSIDTMTADGIRLSAFATGGGSSLKNSVEVLDDVVANVAAYDGIVLRSEVAGGAILDQEEPIVVAGNTVRYTGRDGIAIRNTASTAGELLQAILINDNLVDGVSGTGIGRHGINVDTTASDANTFVRQAITVGYGDAYGVGGNIVRYTENHGIRVGTTAEDAAVVDQANTIDIGLNAVYTTATDGIFVSTKASTAASITQSMNIDDNIVDGVGNDDDGIRVETRTYDDGTLIDQEGTINLRRNTVNHADGNGIHVYNDVKTASALYQTVNVESNVIGTVGEQTIDNDGIRIGTKADGADSFVRQEVAIGRSLYQNGTTYDYGNLIRYVGNNGITVHDEANDGATIDQASTIGIHSNTVTEAVVNGIEVYNGVNGGDGSITQTANVTYNSVSGNEVGIALGNLIFSDDAGAGITQTIDVSNNVSIGNDAQGTALLNLVSYNPTPANADGTIVQTGSIDDNVIDGNATGVLLDNAQHGASYLNQNLVFDPNLITGNTMDGVHGMNDVNDNATLKQSLTFIGATITGNGDDGIDLFNDENGAGSTASLYVYFEDTAVSSNVNIGVRIVNEGDGASTGVYFNPGGNEALGNGGSDDIYAGLTSGSLTVNLNGVTCGSYGSTGGPNIIANTGGNCPP
jgi:hypothetical protein